MKKIGIIFYSILLSLLIILMGGGVTLVQCNHTGNISVAQLSASFDDDAYDEDCCGMEADNGEACDTEQKSHCCHSYGDSVEKQPCMNYTLVKSQPTNFSNVFIPAVQPLCFTVPDFIGAPVVRLAHVVVKALLPECNGRHGPPRNYLRLITILLI